MVLSPVVTRGSHWLPRYISCVPLRGLIRRLECKQHLGLPPYGKISASTSWPSPRRAVCQAEDGHLFSNKGWCSKKKYRALRRPFEAQLGYDVRTDLEHDQWLQFDLGHPSTVTSLITKGRADTNQEQWVTKYRLSFSNDSRLWIYYKEKLQNDPKVSLPR